MPARKSVLGLHAKISSVLEAKPVVNGMTQFLFATQITLRSLNRSVEGTASICHRLRKIVFMRSATRTIERCSWVNVDDSLMLQYHDREWGVPVHDDRKHFEFLVLEAAQAGLSWTIVLKKREGYRRAFDGFNPEKVARYSVRRIEKLALNAEIIRNRMKIEAAVRNARAFLKIQEEFGSFDSYCWRFVDGQPKLNQWKIMRQISGRTDRNC
jgi:DNA-3-methyladenine glycosylase I